MEGLRAQARQRFLNEQLFAGDRPAMQKLNIHLVRIAKYQSDTYLTPTPVPWIYSNELTTRINQPVPMVKNESATATLTLLKIDRQADGTMLFDQRLFIEIFDAFKFDDYWLHMLLQAVYGIFSQSKNGGTLLTSYLNTVTYAMLWSHDTSTKPVATKVLMIPRITNENSKLSPAYSSLVRSMKLHKSLIDDNRFCFFLSATELVYWIQDTVDKHLKQIRLIETKTKHGAWQAESETRVPSTDELVERSREVGFVLTSLANITRHASIAKSLMGPCQLLSNPGPNSGVTSSQSATTAIPRDDDIVNATVMLQGQIESGEQQATYLQERARTQHSVIFNLLTRHDAESSRHISELAQKDSYSMKTIAIVTMIFLPPTFIATLFAMPLLKWDQPQVVQSNFRMYWVFAIPTTLVVLLVWHGTAAEKTVWRKAWEKACTGRARKGSAGKKEV